MKQEPISPSHPLREYFSQTLHLAFETELGWTDLDQVEAYLADMLTHFATFDGIYAIRNAEGKRVQSVVEMLAEGDVRQNADSFDREREVHRHIGDFLLFWSGLYPEHLNRSSSNKALTDVIEQGRFSYHVVSTFEYGPYAEQAGVFRKLSTHFDEFRSSLYRIRASFA